MKKSTKIMAIMLSMILCTGCGSRMGSASETENTIQTETASLTTETSTTAAASTASQLAEDLFTDRDYETDYSDYVTITLEDGASKTSGSGVSIEGDTITITNAGTYVLTGSLSDGQIVVELADDEKAQLVLDHASVTSTTSAALYIKSGDKVFLTTTADSRNVLASTGDYVQTDDNNVDGAIFSRSDLTMNGQGTLTVTSETGHGIVGKDDLKITSGTYEITSACHGISANDSIRIADGSISIQSGGDGMQVSDDKEGKGYIYICGGTITIKSSDDGVHAENALTVTGSVMNIDAHEGLEAVDITISGGDLTIMTDEDGINASGGSQPTLTISGGILHINSQGDSLDANGSLYVTGGEIYITGPSGSDNGIIDYDNAGTISGGCVIGLGVSGMQQNFDQDSTQGSILYTLSSMQAAGTIVTLSDASGNVIVQYTAQESFQVVIVSAPQITAGESYTLTVGTEIYTIEMTSLIYGEGSGRDFGGGMDSEGGMNPGDGMRGGW